MQYRPTAEELLTDVAELLESEVLEAVSGPLQHKVRVAAHLVRVVEREIRLGPDAASAERHRLSLLLNDFNAGLPELRATLASRLADAEPLGAPFERAVYDSLIATARDDIAIAKPGYASWTSDE